MNEVKGCDCDLTVSAQNTDKVVESLVLSVVRYFATPCVENCVRWGVFVGTLVGFLRECRRICVTHSTNFTATKAGFLQTLPCKRRVLQK